MSTPTLASVPAASPPQHPSPSEPLEGIPAGVLEGSRPAPVIGDPRWQGLPRANGRTIRTTPAHCPTAPDLGCLVGFCWALTPTTPPPRPGPPAAPAPTTPGGRGRHLRVVPHAGNGDTPWDGLSVVELRALLRDYPIDRTSLPAPIENLRRAELIEALRQIGALGFGGEGA